MSKYMKLIENEMICIYKVIYNDNKLEEITNELKAKYYEVKKESISSPYDIQTVTNIFNQYHNEAKEFLCVEKSLYNIESEYSRGIYGKAYNIVYKKYSLLQYLINKKSSSLIFDLYDYVNSIYTSNSNISGYFRDKPYIGPEELQMLLSSMNGDNIFMYDSYISKEEKDKYINMILECIRLELVDLKEIADKNEFELASENTVKYKLIIDNYNKVDNDFKVKVK